MRKNVLLLLLLAAVKFATAQYCGASGSNICSTNNTLTQFGISDYRTFPCVHDSVPYSEVMQLYVPDTVVQFGQHVTIYSVIIDSIIGLPCGLCWSCDNSSFTYNGGTRGCIQISGTTTDVHGAYEVGMYGRAVTSLGTFPGSFSIIGFQFFLNVVGQHDTCSPIDILDLHAPCVARVDTSCKHHPAMTMTPASACPLTSAVISVTNLNSPGYTLRWLTMDTAFTERSDSFVSTFTVYRGDWYLNLAISDSTGCTETMQFAMSYGGPVAYPNICYTTTDSSLSTGILKVVYERDNFFNNVASYQIFRADTMWQTSQYMVGESPASQAYVIDTAPVLQGLNSYYIQVVPSCVDTTAGWNGGISGNQYIRSVLTVDTGAGAGYPYLYWTNSDPVNYDQVYIYSRGSSGHWRLRYSSANINSHLWTDLTPDSTHIEYMMGYHINSSCDPSRSSVTAFSNFAGADVTREKVVADTTNTGTLAVNTVREAHLSIYPNPANNKLNIQLSEAGESEIHIYDMEGRLIMSKTLDGAVNNEIDVASLAKGVYALKWTRAGQDMAMIRFLKK